MKQLEIFGTGAARPPLAGWLGALLAGSLTLVSTGAAANKTLTGDSWPTPDGPLIIRPLHHATLALGWKGLTIYVDPVGGAERFRDLPSPDIVLLTDIHGDHLNVETLQAVTGENTALIAPSAVVKRLPAPLQRWAKALDNGETKNLLGLIIEAIPAYNLTEERTKYHAKGRGNGYVLTLGETRVYLSGDTEDIPEMRALQGIDVAFVCMNLPYTMTVAQAADAVRAFKPKVIYPYHYRGSDLNQFKELVGTEAGIEVRIRDWYPDR